MVLLVDGHSLIYRSFFAFSNRPLRDSKGRNTSAVFGFFKTMRKLLEGWRPAYCAVVYDAPGPTFRHEQYGDYKIQRPPTPEELVQQMPIVKKLVAAWGITSLEVPGVEADDVLGTLARLFEENGRRVVVVSSDKDVLQLVGGDTTVYDPWLDLRYGPDQVKEKLGVLPSQVPDYLALVGDQSDNVPGVRGIGPKRARAILEKYCTLQQALAEDPGLAQSREAAELSLGLVQLATDLALEVELADLILKPPDRDVLHHLLDELEFHSLLAGFVGNEEEPVDVRQVEGPVIPDSGRLAFWLDKDIAWFTTDGKTAQEFPVTDVNLRALLGVSRALKAGIDIKRQLLELGVSGLDIAAPFVDVAVMAWLVDPNRRGYGLEELLPWAGKNPRGERGPGAAVGVWDLLGWLEPQVSALGLQAVLDELEMPLVPVLARMEERGVMIDAKYFRGLEGELSGELAAVERRVWQLAGVEFNVRSPQQLAEVLFERLKLPHGRKLKTGYSTNLSVLSGLADRHPVVQEVLRFRELTKLIGTYLSPLLTAARAGTSRVHAEFNQTGASTGRLSSSNPNLQNIPIRTEEGRRIRAGFIAGDGNVLVSADYSQIELRVLAHLSGDEELRAAFERGDDIHIQTAAAVFGVEPAAVSQEQRRMAKVVNYGLIYGMGDFGLSSRMKIPLEEARGFLDDYMAKFQGVARWRDHLLAEAGETGVVRTLSGRIRPVPGVTSRNRNVADAARRAAINAPVQGSAADIIKRAMIRLEERFRMERIQPGMLIQVHDELLFEVPAGRLEEACRPVRQEMECAWQLDVPLVVDIGTGQNWGEAH